jgi:hypothetical protein
VPAADLDDEEWRDRCVALYPIALVQDRYSGCYSGGDWLAVANANHEFRGTSRAHWLMGDDGPHGGDLVAGVFWRDRPPWVVVGDTPDRALANLIASDEAKRAVAEWRRRARNPTGA